MPLPPRVVPWTSNEEYEQVYSWLYAEAPDFHLRELGVKRVKAWKSRGRVPQAIETTAGFVEISLRDYFESGRISSHELRLMYTMVFIRFVNGLVDAEQNKQFAQSVAGLADKLNLPAWFVDLRHAGTHENLPSLQTLRTGCQQALQWLNDNYWSVKKTYPDCITEIREQLSTYKDLGKQFSKDPKRTMNPNADNSPSQKALREIISLNDPDTLKLMLIPVLLENGFLVPTGKKKRSTLPELNLSQDLLALWTPLFQRFDGTWKSFGDDLVAGILDQFDYDETPFKISGISDPTQDENTKRANRSTSYLLTLTAWLKHFVKSYYTKEDVLLSSLQMDDLLEGCLRKPTVYTRNVLLTVVEYDPELGKRLSPFIKFITKSLSNKNNIKNFKDVPALTDGDMQREIHKLKARVIKVFGETREDEETSDSMEVDANDTPQNGDIDGLESSSKWKLYDVDLWTSCPFGTLPGGVVPSLDLPLDLDGPNSLVR
ncbi:rRNA-processing protein las1 [Basidiobolus ranarum]|uniref:rRNA-processing protein las1 n=1 Tax=Basidiobolus ranarum TaxID=34480 RepID=A0ABR2WY86_9FUNG